MNMEVLDKIDVQLCQANDLLHDLYEENSIDPHHLNSRLRKTIGCLGVLTCQLGLLIEQLKDEVAS